jgi:hypothetical protein
MQIRLVKVGGRQMRLCSLQFPAPKINPAVKIEGMPKSPCVPILPSVLNSTALAPKFDLTADFEIEDDMGPVFDGIFNATTSIDESSDCLLPPLANYSDDGILEFLLGS